MAGAILKTLRSLRFTIFLVICLAAIFLLGLIIPQKSLLGRDMYLQWKQRNIEMVSFLDAIKFTDIYVSPITIGLWILFFLNLIFIMSNRIPLIWNRCFRVIFPANIDTVKNSKHYEVIDSPNMESAKAILEKEGYKVFEKDNAFTAVKNRFSPLATILFHLSFFLLLIGGVVSFYTIFKAEVELAAGETFEGQYRWTKSPKLGDNPRTRFTVEAIIPTYYNKTVPMSLDVVLQTKSGREVIGINKPYKEGPLSFVVKNIDIAPLFLIKDKNGKEIDGAYIKLNVLGGKDDYFIMAGFKFRAIFYTDYSAEMPGYPKEKANLPQALKQTPMLEEAQPKEVVNPAFKIDVLKDGKLLKTETIKRGESIEFDDYSLIFAGLTYWAKFYVVKEYGLGIIYTGFTLMVLALVIRFIFPRRDIKGVLENNRLHIGGRGEFYLLIFEENFKRLIDTLKI